jgi:uncharacterized membrane protein
VVLAAILASSGTIHLVRPTVFDPIVPRSLPGPARFYTLASGAAELVTAGLLFEPRTRRLGGVAAAALLVAVFPANVGMANSALRHRPRSTRRIAATIARLPLQLPLVAAAIAVAAPDPSPRRRRDGRAGRFFR